MLTWPAMQLNKYASAKTQKLAPGNFFRYNDI
jgi:hypothetical protein